MKSRVARHIGCVVLSFVILAMPVAAQDMPAMNLSKLKTMLMKVPTGAPVTVRTLDGVQLRGKLMGLTDDGFEVQALVNDNIETRALSFSDVAKLETGPRRSRFAKVFNPLMTVMSLVGTAAAITAAVQ